MKSIIFLLSIALALAADPVVVGPAPSDIQIQTLYLEKTNSLLYYQQGNYQGQSLTYYMQLFDIKTQTFKTLQNLPNQYELWSFSVMEDSDLLCSLAIIESTSNPNGEAAIACWNFTSGNLYTNITVTKDLTGGVQFTKLWKSSDQVFVAVGNYNKTQEETASMNLSVWNIKTKTKVWSNLEKVVGWIRQSGFNHDMLTMVGYTNIFNGSQFVHTVCQCEVRNVLSSKQFPLRFSLPDIVVDGTENYEYAFLFPFTHPTLQNYVAVNLFKEVYPVAPIQIRIINTQVGSYVSKLIDFGNNALIVQCKTLYSPYMIIACTDNKYIKVFNASSTANPISPSYTLSLVNTPLQSWESWDVNGNGTSIYYTTTNSTYKWDYAS